MQQNRHSVIWSVWTVALTLILTIGTTKAFSQKTVVQDAGGGRKMELVYNSAGQVTERRMLGADGKLTDKTEYEYRPGFYQAQEVVTSYWPNGNIKMVTRTSYDANSNFTLEFVQVYEQSGKQVGGHRLTHEPQTNVFHCYEWRPGASDYQERECPPPTEGGGEGAEEVKKYTYEEVAQHLDAARNAAGQEQETRRIRPVTPEVHPGATTKDIGLVLPAQIKAGERFSGTIVQDPEQYDDMPGVKVSRVTLPSAASGTRPGLTDWEIVASGEKPQRADGPVSFVLPPGSSQLRVTFRQVEAPATSVSKLINLDQANSAQKVPRSFKAPALCLIGQLCAVSGPFSGDSKQTFVAVGERPAAIIAETRDIAYLSISNLVAPGAPSLFIAEGSKLIALPVVVAELTLEPSHQNLSQGQTLAINVRVDGPEDLPEAAWQTGNFPAANLARARKLVPGYNLAPEAHDVRKESEKPEKAENRPGQTPREEQELLGGEVLLVVRNETPQLVTLRDSKNGGYVFPLHRQSFKRGGFSYDFVAEAVQSGAFAVKAYLIPFLAPVAGQEFVVKTGTPKK